MMARSRDSNSCSSGGAFRAISWNSAGASCRDLLYAETNSARSLGPQLGEETSPTSHTALFAAALNSAGSACSAWANAERRLERLCGQNSHRSSIAISEISTSSVGAGWPAPANDSAMLANCCQLKPCGE
eukprot:scaffold44188_cov63-Phaeocystis_antarctica.AAC.3